MTAESTTGKPPSLHFHRYRRLVRRALEEDLGEAGDLTTDAIVPTGAEASARIVTREDGVVAGLSVAASSFRMLDDRVETAPSCRDGDRVTRNTTLALVKGPAHAVLSAERVALNFLGRLSGIATSTAKLVAAVEGYPARVTCTRKTTPGLRVLEKYAVRVGGGSNHRFALDDAVLIKDNHRALAGSITRAVEDAKASVGHMVKIEVEVDTLDQLEEALSCPIDAVLLDNMSPSDLGRAVKMVSGRLITEASGNITLENARRVAATGVDILSVGWLTHSAPSLDVALEIDSFSTP